MAPETGYCPLIWSFSSRSSLAKVERTHIRATALASNNNTNVPQKSVHDQYCELLLKEICKTKCELNPFYMHTVFTFKENSRYNLRSGCSVIRNRIKSSKWGLRSVSYIGAQLWESLPKSVKLAPSLKLFSYKVRQLENLNCKCCLCASYVKNLGFII